MSLSVTTRPWRPWLPVARLVVGVAALAGATAGAFWLLPAGPADVPAPASLVLPLHDSLGFPSGSATIEPAGDAAVRVRVEENSFRSGLGPEPVVTLYRGLPPWLPPTCNTLAASLAAGRAQARPLGATRLGRFAAVLPGTLHGFTADTTVLAVGSSCVDVPATS